MSYVIRQQAMIDMGEFLAEKVGYYHSVFDTADHLPCFLHRVNIPGQLQIKADIRKFISLALKAQTGDVECICISVTERDANMKKVLQVAKEEFGADEVGPFESIHGEYNCYALFITQKHDVNAIKRKA